MSYNISTFKLKKLENFSLPVESLFKHERDDWHPRCIENGDGTVTYEVTGDGSEITGVVCGGTIDVTSFECWGEGSGTTMAWIFEPALKESAGYLEAVCIWEGGDAINRLIVNNGAVSWEDVEL